MPGSSENETGLFYVSLLHIRPARELFMRSPIKTEYTTHCFDITAVVGVTLKARTAECKDGVERILSIRAIEQVFLESSVHLKNISQILSTVPGQKSGYTELTQRVLSRPTVPRLLTWYCN